MGLTPKYGLPYPEATDSIDLPRDLGALAGSMYNLMPIPTPWKSGGDANTFVTPDKRFVTENVSFRTWHDVFRLIIVAKATMPSYSTIVAMNGTTGEDASTHRSEAHWIFIDRNGSIHGDPGNLRGPDEEHWIKVHDSWFFPEGPFSNSDLTKNSKINSMMGVVSRYRGGSFSSGDLTIFGEAELYFDGWINVHSLNDAWATIKAGDVVRFEFMGFR